MSAKQVWGVIIIVLGIIVVINCVSTIYTADFYGNEIRTTGLLIEKHGGKKFFNTNHYMQLVAQEKQIAVIGIIVGILMAVVGTLMLKKKSDYKETKYNDYPDDEYDEDIF